MLLTPRFQEKLPIILPLLALLIIVVTGYFMLQRAERITPSFLSEMKASLPSGWTLEYEIHETRPLFGEVHLQNVRLGYAGRLSNRAGRVSLHAEHAVLRGAWPLMLRGPKSLHKLVLHEVSGRFDLGLSGDIISPLIVLEDLHLGKKEDPTLPFFQSLLITEASLDEGRTHFQRLWMNWDERRILKSGWLWALRLTKESEGQNEDWLRVGRIQFEEADLRPLFASGERAKSLLSTLSAGRLFEIRDIYFSFVEGDVAHIPLVALGTKYRTSSSVSQDFEIRDAHLPHSRNLRSAIRNLNRDFGMRLPEEAFRMQAKHHAGEKTTERLLPKNTLKLDLSGMVDIDIDYTLSAPPATGLLEPETLLRRVEITITDRGSFRSAYRHNSNKTAFINQVEQILAAPFAADTTQKRAINEIIRQALANEGRIIITFTPRGTLPLSRFLTHYMQDKTGALRSVAVTYRAQ